MPVCWQHGIVPTVMPSFFIVRYCIVRYARAPPEVAAELAMHTAEDQLTERELEILKLIAKGNANKEIAAQLSIREDTVKSHVGNILEKLDANDRTHAVTIGLKRGIIEL